MQKKPPDTAVKLPQQVAVERAQIEGWPSEQKIQPLDDPTRRVTGFNNNDRHHEALIKQVLGMGSDLRYGENIFPGGCGAKVRSLEEWRIPVARLIHARAMRPCQPALGKELRYDDDAWTHNPQRRPLYALQSSAFAGQCGLNSLVGR